MHNSVSTCWVDLGKQLNGHLYFRNYVLWKEIRGHLWKLRCVSCYILFRFFFYCRLWIRFCGMFKTGKSFISTWNSFAQNMFLQAYASYMKGALFFEQDKNIEAAMINFKNTRFVKLSLFFLEFTIIRVWHYFLCWIFFIVPFWMSNWGEVLWSFEYLMALLLISP